MGIKFVKKTIGDCFDLINGYAFKSNEFISSGNPVIKIKNIKAGYFSEHEFSYVDDNFLITKTEKIVQESDLLISMTGNRHDGTPETWVGKIALFPYKKINNFFLNQRVGALRVKDNAKINPIYASYVLSSWEYQQWFIAIATSSGGQANLSPKQILETEFEFPDKNIQDLIANILSSFDKKITLNRQINQTLEQMAQTLFKSWFVDFDPVIDNALDAGNDIPDTLQERAELRQKVRASQDFQPLPADVRALFPAEFEESELGWVPKGWVVKAADEISTISIGKTPPRIQTQWFSESNVENVTWISIKDMGNCGVFTRGSSEYLVPEGIDKFNVKIVPKDSVILSFKLTLGRVSITSCDLTTNEAIAHFVSPKMGLTKEFIYCYLSCFDYGSLGSTSSIATAVNSKIIKQMPFIVPHIQISSLFEKKVCSFFQKLRLLAEETEALTQLRDTLLPKLISGELRLDEIPTP